MTWFKGLNEKLTCSFRTATFPIDTMDTSDTSPMTEVSELVNLYPSAKGELKKISFKTFKGLISELERANKNCKKYKMKTEIRIMLPIRGKLKK